MVRNWVKVRKYGDSKLFIPSINKLSVGLPHVTGVQHIGSLFVYNSYMHVHWQIQGALPPPNIIEVCVGTDTRTRDIILFLCMVLHSMWSEKSLQMLCILPFGMLCLSDIGVMLTVCMLVDMVV